MSSSLSSLATSFDTAARRLHVSHVLRGTDTVFSLFVFSTVLLFGYFVKCGGTVVSLVGEIGCCTLAVSALYTALGGVVYRRNPKDQAKWLCEATVSDAVCDGLDALHRASTTKRLLWFGIVVLLGEMGTACGSGAVLMTLGGLGIATTALRRFARPS